MKQKTGRVSQGRHDFQDYRKECCQPIAYRNLEPCTVDTNFCRTHAKNLMFVRFRANTWNRALQHKAVQYYAGLQIPTVLTFMAYFDTADKIPPDHKTNYVFRKRTLNHHWAITTKAWREIMRSYEDTPYEKWVYSCGKIEGEAGTSACRHCGNCLREYYATMERMKKGGNHAPRNRKALSRKRKCNTQETCR